MYSILIMGGSDFIGSSLAKYFINKKYTVDIMTEGDIPINYNGIHKHLICNRKMKEEVKQVLQENNYDYVYDLDATELDEIKILINNLHKVSLKKYVLLLSQTNMKHKKLEIKKFIEQMTIPYIIIKSSNIYGDKSKFSREMILFEKIDKSKPINIPKNRKLKTQFIYIEDFIKVLCSLIRVKQVKEVYDVTNPQVISLEEYIKTCGEIMGKEPNIKYIEEGSIDNDIIDNFEIDYIDIDKIIKDGLYIPNILFQNGISLLYDWYKNDKQSKLKIRDKIVKVLQIG